jgi:subtilisin family serine protease
MKKIIRYPLALLSLALLSLTACEVDQPFGLVSQQAETISSPVVQSRAGEIIPNAYIVQFKQDLPELAEMRVTSTERPAPETHQLRQANSKSQTLTRQLMANIELPEARVQKVFDLPGSKGFSIKATDQEVSRLKKDPRVAHVEPDRIISLGLTPIAFSKSRLIPADDGPASQALTYGVQRVGGTKNMSGSNKVAWIVDSGIDTDHQDLNVQTALGKDYTGSNSLEDGLGHGTHIAGIIGALDNGIGVVGVAAGITLVPIRVLDDNGEGTVSGLIEALCYIGEYASWGDVVNLSVGAEKSIALDDAVKALRNCSGVRIVIAAGNEAASTSNCSPAGIDEYKIYVAGAIDENDAFCSFSNYGSNVDYLLPGANIYSTYKNNQYTSLSGTSMAAPFLAGLLLIDGLGWDYDIEDDGWASTPGGSKPIAKWEYDD